MSTISVVGSLNMDLVIRTPRFPDAGETISGEDYHTIPGGKGANQAMAIARQSDNVNIVGRLGVDAFGERIISYLRSQNVATGHLELLQNTATGVAIIVVDASGENRIILAPGANHMLTPEDMYSVEALIADSDALVMQLEVPLPVVAAAAAIARGHGVPVLLNAAPARDLPEELLASVDYLIVNETEAALLCGCSADEPAEAACRLRLMGARCVIVTLGAQGALFTDGATTMTVPGFKVSVVDTTAAGDAFVGAFASAVTAGKTTREAVRWANAGGALATTVLGAQPSLPTREAVANFIAQQDQDQMKGGGAASMM